MTIQTVVVNVTESGPAGARYIAVANSGFNGALGAAQVATVEVNSQFPVADALASVSGDPSIAIIDESLSAGLALRLAAAATSPYPNYSFGANGPNLEMDAVDSYSLIEVSTTEDNPVAQVTFVFYSEGDLDELESTCPPGYGLTDVSEPVSTTLVAVNEQLASPDTFVWLAGPDAVNPAPAVLSFVQTPAGTVINPVGTTVTPDEWTSEAPVTFPVQIVMSAIDGTGNTLLRDDAGLLAPLTPTNAPYTFLADTIIEIAAYIRDDSISPPLFVSIPGTYTFFIPATIPGSTAYCAFNALEPPTPPFRPLFFPPNGGAPLDNDPDSPTFGQPAFPDFPVDVGQGAPSLTLSDEVRYATRLWGGPTPRVLNRAFLRIQSVLSQLVDKDDASGYTGVINLNGKKLLNLKPYDASNPLQVLTKDAFDD